MLASTSIFFLARQGKLFSFKILFRKAPRKIVKMVLIEYIFEGDRTGARRWTHIPGLLFEPQARPDLHPHHEYHSDTVGGVWVGLRESPGECRDGCDCSVGTTFLWWGTPPYTIREVFVPHEGTQGEGVVESAHQASLLALPGIHSHVLVPLLGEVVVPQRPTIPMHHGLPGQDVQVHQSAGCSNVSPPHHHHGPGSLHLCARQSAIRTQPSSIQQYRSGIV